MAARLRRRGDNGLDAWPGYVDALSTLLMVIIFVLLVFILAQGFLATTLSGRNHALDEARQELTALRQALNQEQARGNAAEAAAQRLGGELAAATAARASLADQLAALRDMTGKLTQERDRAAQQLADITLAYDAARIATTRLESGLAEARGQAQAATTAATAAQAAQQAAERQAAAAGERLGAAEKDTAGLRERLAAEQADAAGLRDRVAAAETASGTMRERLAASETEAAATRDRLAAAEKDLAAMRTRLAAAAKDNAGLRERQDEIETAAAATRSRLAEAEKELTTARDRVAIVERTAINARNDATAAADRAATAEKATTAARAEAAAANERLAAAEKEITAARERLAVADKAAASLRTDLSAATARAAASERDLAAARERLAAIEKDLATAQRQLAEAQKQRDEMQRQIAALDRTVTADKTVIEAKLSELAELTRQARGLTALRDELARQVRELTARLADQTEARGKAEAASEEQRRRAEAGDVNAIILRQEIATLRAELGSIAKALEVTRQEGAAKDTKIADLGRELNAALAQKVEQLQRYRSEFFGRLRTVLEQRSGVQVVGDRFVLQGEILFPPGSAELTEGGIGQMTTLALTVRQIAAEIPPDIPWVLRVDGHTDPTPVRGGQFASNWELSAARAITVVKWLIAAGVPPERLVAAGFGEYQPLVPGATPDAYAKDRRIELRLTDR